jgi:hypothetical protein
MTSQELDAIEARCKAATPGEWICHLGQPDDMPESTCRCRSHRRPRALGRGTAVAGLVESAEWFHYDDVKTCPWCGASEVREFYGIDRAARIHESDCPAFTPDGDVR